MLDQNTDRMWYVIGAVIIGAAIIFIMNGAFPNLFASVAGTFDEAKDSALATVVDVGKDESPQCPELTETNYLINGNGLKMNSLSSTNKTSAQYDLDYARLSRDAGFFEGLTMGISFKVRNTSGTGGNVALSYVSATGEGATSTKVIAMTDEWTEHYVMIKFTKEMVNLIGNPDDFFMDVTEDSPPPETSDVPYGKLMIRSDGSVSGNAGTAHTSEISCASMILPLL